MPRCNCKECRRCREELGMKFDGPGFTEKQWAEIYYAVDSKLKSVEDGPLGPDEEWVDEMKAIKSDLEEYFSESGILY